MTDDDFDEENGIGDNPFVCERCKSPECDCGGKCCTYCNGYQLQLEIEAQEEALAHDSSLPSPEAKQ